MDAATVSRIMALIPDRVARAPSGVAFGDVRATTCVHPERLALLTEFLHWLSPIYPTTKDDQMRFGLFAGKHLPVEEEEDGEEALALEEEAGEETLV